MPREKKFSKMDKVGGITSDHPPELNSDHMSAYQSMAAGELYSAGQSGNMEPLCRGITRIFGATEQGVEQS